MFGSVARPPQHSSRTWRAAGGAAGCPTAQAGGQDSPVPAQDPEQTHLCPTLGSPHTNSSQSSSLPRPRQIPPSAATLVAPGGTGVSPQPRLSLCHLCFAVTDRQAPARGTINYSHALFLNIDVKSKFPACPSPAPSPRDFHATRSHVPEKPSRGGTLGGTCTATSAGTGAGLCISGWDEKPPGLGNIPSHS